MFLHFVQACISCSKITGQKRSIYVKSVYNFLSFLSQFCSFQFRGTLLTPKSHLLKTRIRKGKSSVTIKLKMEYKDNPTKKLLATNAQHYVRTALCASEIDISIYYKSGLGRPLLYFVGFFLATSTTIIHPLMICKNIKIT